MKLDRNKIIEENMDFLSDDNIETLKRMSDYEICKFLVWDRTHSIIWNLYSKISTNFFIFSLCIQAAALLSNIFAKYRHLSSETINRSSLITCIIVVLLFICNLAVQFLCNRFYNKAVEDLSVVNNYSDMIRDTTIDEINKIRDLQGK